MYGDEVKDTQGKEKKRKRGQGLEEESGEDGEGFIDLCEMIDMLDSGDGEKEAVDGKAQRKPQWPVSDGKGEEGDEFSTGCASRESGSGYGDDEEPVAKFSEEGEASEHPSQLAKLQEIISSLTSTMKSSKTVYGNDAGVRMRTARKQRLAKRVVLHPGLYPKGKVTLEPNPWLAQDSTSSLVGPKTPALVSGWEESKNAGVSPQPPNDRTQSRNDCDGPVPDIGINVNAILKFGSNERRAGGDRDSGGEEGDADDERAVNPVPTKGRKGVNVDQRDLVIRDFGGDNIVAEYRAEKKKIGEDGEQVIDTSIPGWGSWAGTGPTEQKRKGH
ncbi:hypothetical protein HOY80DRAFT_1101469 [Tuber brumale]|nr:hypothetical protein HOY80DRAFT_1101469 [Tuber brumale]